MNHFNLLGLPETLNQTLHQMQFSKPTPIQAQTIPHALGGHDILGSAQTGTGKTAAFGIPIAARLLSNQRGSALVMTPTRELASQVMQQLQAILGKSSQVKTALLIGGDSISNQLKQLKNRPRLLVGTPGRIYDHLQQGNLMLHDTDILVLDETDRMLDMGFTSQIEKILKFMPKTRQTMLFSATLPNNIIKISEKYLNNPVRVSVDSALSPAKNIQHNVLRVSEEGKYPSLLSELDVRKGSIIVFVKTKFGTEKMAKELSKAGHDADAIHGDLRQNKRDRVIANFRNRKYRILVATDVAARGLDIPHIEHVINYDLPHCAEDYIHRIGRTARAGASGSAMCLLTPANVEKWNVINQLMNPNAAKMKTNERRHTKRLGKSLDFKNKGRKFGRSAKREAA
ncbi:MAG: DEAD/DEAH box helicase [Burkholderiales bacterium]|nr:DEAD/DEAH box helicase [Burkholderiales bacterium]MDR4518302.1 DEAD/DEAH box helicase [Nitrosomonas sp.]